MEINTRVFGTVNINEEDIITFEEGLIGLEDMHKFVLLGDPESNESLVWLQSLNREDLAFVVIQPRYIRPDYQPGVHVDDLAGLGLEEQDHALLYAIVAIPEDVTKITANLKAPLIINVKNNRAKQIILNTDRYSVKEPLLAQE